jgi:TonB family protein
MMSEVAKSQEQIKKNTRGKKYTATKVNSYYCLSSEEYTNTSMGSFEDTFSMKDETLDVKSKIIKHVPPRYPSKAAKNNIEGYVTSSVVIDEQGCYVNIKVIESYPKGVFDQSVIYALKGWKSSPALIDGKPVRVKDTIRLDFHMPKKSAPKSKMEIDLEKLAAEKLKGL